LPVSPADEVFVSNLTNLVDLLAARAFAEAGTELGKDEGDTKTLSVLRSSADSLLVPLEANVGVLDLGLTSSTFRLAELTAVGMGVQHVQVGANLTTGRLLEANGEDISTQDSDLVGRGNGLEPHLLGSVIFLVLFEDPLVQRSKDGLVHVAGDKQHWVF